MLSSLSVLFALFSSVNCTPNPQSPPSKYHNDAAASEISTVNHQPIFESAPAILLSRTTPNTTAVQHRRSYIANGDLTFLLGSNVQSALFKKMYADFRTAALAFAHSSTEGFKVGANAFLVGFNYGAFSLMIYYYDKLTLLSVLSDFFEDVWVALHPTSYWMFTIVMSGATFFYLDMLEEGTRRRRGPRG